MKRVFQAISSSFRRKLIFINLSAVFLTALVLFAFMMNNFNSITSFSLAQNSQSMESTVEDYLRKLTKEKADATWLQIKSAMDNLTVVGRTAQNVIDHADELSGLKGLYELPLFRTSLEKRNGALSSAPGELVNTLVPPPLVGNPEAIASLRLSALLNLSLPAAFDANLNNAFLYYVGATPVTRAYPNIDLAEVLGEGINALFWKDYFAPNVPAWTRYFTDESLRKTTATPVTVEAPYADAAGQGMMVTMFYPLWDAKAKRFAGAVGADITLAKIIANILESRLAKTGFTFLMSGKGEIIAMPSEGRRLFRVNLEETKQGSLTYYRGALAGSEIPAVQALAESILRGRNTDLGLTKLDLSQPGGAVDRHIVVWSSLPALNDNQYGHDVWKIVISVPESEIFEALNATHRAISAESWRTVLVTILILALFLGLITGVSLLVSGRTTRDLQNLAAAAEQISAKNYDVDLRIHSNDEIGQLGSVFTNMARQIKEYTVDLESKVAERTADLVLANEQITRLNARLTDENLRLGAELDVARRLQMMVLPGEKEIAAIKGLDIACFMRPADEVGGDYYDVLNIGDTVFLGIGDVTGHGLSAGVIMLMAQTALMTLSQTGEKDVSTIMNVLNRVLYQNILRIREDKNMTLAVLQYHAGEFILVGQHESVLICRADGSLEEIDTIDLGLPVGLEADIHPFIATTRIKLDTGDIMVLYTDGVTEAVGPSKRQFGIEGLRASLAANHHKAVRDIVEHTMAALYEHIAGTTIYDDISLVVIKKQ